VEQPVGTLQGTHQAYQIGANSQLLQVDVLARSSSLPPWCASAHQQVGRVVDGSDAPLQLDWSTINSGKLTKIWRQPGSNTFQLVDRIKAMLPRIEARTMAAIFGSCRSPSVSAADRNFASRWAAPSAAGSCVEALTLFTIPVTYVYMEHLSEWLSGAGKTRRPSSIARDHGLVAAGHYPQPVARHD
jgi:hypothetical protein